MLNKLKNLIKNGIKPLKENLEIIKENFILLLGIGLFIYNLFNFSSGRYCDRENGLEIGFLNLGCKNSATYYDYDYNTLILLTIGAIFIVIGLIKLRRKYSE